MSLANNFTPGDIFYTHPEKQYLVFKLLAAEPALGIYHVLSYAPMDSLPAVDDLKTAPVAIYHVPMGPDAFTNPTLLGSSPLTAGDLIGYHTFLRETQEPEQYVPLASGYFSEAFALTDEEKYEEAIDAYTKAIDLIPPFFEAIDNRAFCKMDMGLWEEAIADFQLSLETNPGSALAEFSIGECYVKLEDYANAKIHLKRADEIAPGDEATQHYLKFINAKSSHRRTT